ncbi:MAG: iron ABC transporter permease [Microbacteriaceae bacterium]|nr:iron ABC transporter permease [Microbacteriaceae bacterium]
MVASLDRNRLWLITGIPVAVFVLAFFYYPLANILGTGFSSLSDTGVESLLTSRLLAATARTIFYSLSATVLSVLFGMPLAFLLYRVRFPGQRILRSLVLVPFMLPTIVVGLAFRALFRSNGALGFLGLHESATAVVLALTFFNIALIARSVGSSWARLDYRQEDAAASLGATPFQVFWSVTLPNLRKAILASASLVFLFCATSFGLVLMVGGVRASTIETEIYLQVFSFGNLGAAAILATLQLVIVLVLLWVTRGSGYNLGVDAATSVRKFTVRNLPILFASLPGAVLILVPLGYLVFRSFSYEGSFGFGNFVQASAEGVWDSALASVTIAIASSAISIPLALFAAISLSRRQIPGAVGGWFNTALLLPLGASSVVLGLGLLLTASNLGIAGWWIIVPLAQGLVALPLVLQTMLPALKSIPSRRLEAAASLGSGPVSSLFRIELPSIRPVVLVSIGFALATALGEFGATSFLARPGQITLPVFIYQAISSPKPGSFGVALAAAVILTVLTVTVLVVTEYGFRKVGKSANVGK